MKLPQIIAPDPNKPKDSSLGMLNWLSIIILLFGILIVVLFGTSLTGKATIFLWMLACILTGTAIGFLFGIPKILQNTQVSGSETGTVKPTYQQQVNTNLTEISDWLTKIIVGLGLVNLTKIPPYLSAVAKTLAAGLSEPTTPPTSLAIAFAYGTIVSYTILGFLFGYITTRLYLASAFSEADQKALRTIAQKTAEAAGAAQSALQKAEFALITAPANSRTGNQTAEEKLEQLAQTYIQVRSAMPSGNPRTRKMTEIMKGMIETATSLPSFDISQALKDKDAGKRLTGYAYLYAKADYQYLEELVDAIISDHTPFGQYWGIQALGKILETSTNSKIDSNILNKLKPYYDKLGKGIDREYELGKLLPELKK